MSSCWTLDVSSSCGHPRKAAPAPSSSTFAASGVVGAIRAPLLPGEADRFTSTQNTTALRPGAHGSAIVARLGRIDYAGLHKVRSVQPVRVTLPDASGAA